MLKLADSNFKADIINMFKHLKRSTVIMNEHMANTGREMKT